MLLGLKCQTLSYHFLSPRFMDTHWNKAEMAACQIFSVMSLSQPGLFTVLCKKHICTYSCGTPLVFWLVPTKFCCVASVWERRGGRALQVIDTPGLALQIPELTAPRQSVLSHVYPASGHSILVSLVFTHQYFSLIFTSLSPVLSYVAF